MLEYALKYASFGWGVFPCHSIRENGVCTCNNRNCTNQGKHPATPRGLKDASKDPAQIRRWWDLSPDANIGVVTGKTSGLVVVDVDTGAGKDGESTLQDLETEHGKLPDTAMAITGSGGQHYLFRYPESVEKIKSGSNNIGSAIDSRGDGGYIIAPPSLHLSGNRYEWEGSSDPTEGATLAALPAWLTDKLKDVDCSRVPVEQSAKKLTSIEMREIRAALAFINPDERDDWLRVGMGLHSTAAGQQAYGLWCEWSQGSDKYDSADQRKTWSSFKAGGVNLGSVYHMAQSSGWMRTGRIQQAAQAINQSAMADNPPPSIPLDARWELIDDSRDAKEKKERTPKEYCVMKFKDLAAHQFPEPEYVIEPWLPMRGICMLFAKAGLGKTWAALDIAISAAGGRPALDHWKVPKKRRVLYLDGEMDGAEFRDRALRLAVSKGLDEDIELSVLGLSLQEEGMPMVDDTDCQEDMDTACQDADLIIVDNLSSLTRMPENEGESWIPVQEWALRMRAQGRSVLFIHHAGKSGDQRGTSRREDVMNSVVVLKAVEDADEDRLVFDWSFRKHRGFNGKDTEARRIELIDEDNGGLSWDVMSLADLEKGDLIQYVRDGWSYQDIGQEFGISKGAVAKRVKRAVAEGKLSNEELPKRGGKR